MVTHNNSIQQSAVTNKNTKEYVSIHFDVETAYKKPFKLQLINVQCHTIT